MTGDAMMGDAMTGDAVAGEAVIEPGALPLSPPRARLADYAREVVEFSELPQEVIARPVKTYSSGMFMRCMRSPMLAILSPPNLRMRSSAVSGSGV